jgi:DNA-binding CsgD family transcriptional regulator
LAQAKLEALLEGLQRTTSIEDLRRSVISLRDIFEIEHVVYYTVNRIGEQFGAVSYDPAWVQRYIDADYQSVDPVVQGVKNRFTAVNWKSLDWSRPASRAFLKESIDAGVGNQGYTIPIWGPRGELAVLTINHRANDVQWASFTKANLRDLLLVSQLVHQEGKRIHAGALAPSSQPDLSPRERDVLLLLGKGRSRGAVADALKISENTLRAYIDSARHKLGALNTTHAIALALSKGVISP